MKKLPLIVCLLVAAALVAVWSMNQRTKAELQQQTAALQQAKASVEELRAENERIKGQITDAGATESEQTSELLKMRGEVSRLRQDANELNTLRAQNEQLRERAAAVHSEAQTTNTPPDVPPQDIHPKETWAFAGYATPDATMQSILWAATQTNREAFLSGFTPQMREEIDKYLSDDPAAFNDNISNETGFRVVNRKTISDEEMNVTIYSDRDQNQNTTRFKRINGEWKVDGAVN